MLTALAVRACGRLPRSVRTPALLCRPVIVVPTGLDKHLRNHIVRALCSTPADQASEFKSSASNVAAIDNPYQRDLPWLGAYFTLREDDPAAVANREKRKSRKGNTRGRFIVATLEKGEIAKLKAERPFLNTDFQQGDILEVEHRPSLSDPPERAVGLCIARHSRGLGTSFRLLCKPDDLPVEYQFMLYSPLLLGITLRTRPAKRSQRSL